MRAYLSENRMWEMFGMRPFSLIVYGGADLGEVAGTIQRIGDDGSADDWHREWSATAERLLGVANQAADAGHRTSAREAYARAATYYFTSYSPLYGKPVDSRLRDSFDASMAAMARSTELAEHPVEFIEIPFEDGSLPAYFSRPDNSGTRRPTIVHTNGYDSSIVEMYTAHVPAATARGYNIVVFDGPGQGRNLIHDGKPLRPDWETVVGPVLDHVMGLPGVDTDRVVLAGWSFGGFLAPRAAAGEDRIAALVADPGQWDQRDNVVAKLPIDDDAKARFPDVDPSLLKPMEDFIVGPDADPFLHWQIAQRGFWVNGVDGVYDYLADMCRYELSSVAERITCPTWLSQAEGDPTAGGAPKLLDAISAERKHLQNFTDAEGSGGHCEGTARRLFHQRMYDWLDETLEAL